MFRASLDLNIKIRSNVISRPLYFYGFCFDGERCNSNYDSNPERITVFRFPKIKEERDARINSLPTKVVVRDYTEVCVKHYSADYPRKPCQGLLGNRPVNPSSEFGATPSR